MNARGDDLAIWRRVATGAFDATLAGRPFAEPTRPTPRELEALRAAVGDAARVLTELLAARARAAARLEHVDRWLVDRVGVEQASSTAVARHKAARFAAAGVATVVDLCSGVGGDAAELVAALGAAAVEAVDRDPLRAMMTAHNAGCAVREADAAERAAAIGPDVAFHFDPARRTADGRRLWRLADLEPGPELIRRVATAGAPGAIKLGPGVDHAELAAAGFAAEAEVELVGAERRLQQAVLWCGALARAPGSRTATDLDRGLGFTGRPVPADAVDGAVGAVLLEPRPALERADLVGARIAATGAPLVELAPGLGLYTGPPGGAADDGWFDGFDVVELVAWRPKKVRAALAAHGLAATEIKTRGGAIDPAAARRELGGAGAGGPATVFVLRIGRRLCAVLTRRRGPVVERRGDAGIVPAWS